MASSTSMPPRWRMTGRSLRPGLGLASRRFRQLGNEADQLAGLRANSAATSGRRTSSARTTSITSSSPDPAATTRWSRVADHPEGPWKNLREDDSPIVSGGGNAGRIVPAYNMDSQPFIDDDGQAYMYWGWAESMAAKLTPDLKNIDGPVHFLKGTKWLPNGGDAAAVVDGRSRRVHAGHHGRCPARNSAMSPTATRSRPRTTTRTGSRWSTAPATPPDKAGEGMWIPSRARAGMSASP